MSEYIVDVGNADEEYIEHFGHMAKTYADNPIREIIVRCRDCKHATINIYGECKYCELLWLPDVDGYGADPQVRFPGDHFCAWGERREQ